MKLAALAACAVLALPCAARASARFAIVVGNNHGATGRARLWFAEKDAERHQLRKRAAIRSNVKLLRSCVQLSSG